MKPTPRTHALKTTLIALMLAAVNPAHATGVPTVDGSAILTNLQQWYQSAMRDYNRVMNMKPGQIVTDALGLDNETKKKMGDYISALQNVKTQMNEAKPCEKYPIEASKLLCTQEEDLKVQKIDAYIALLNGVKADYEKLNAKLAEYNNLGFTTTLTDFVDGGGTTNDGQRKTLEVEIAQLRQQILTNMQNNKGQIDLIEGQIKLVNGIRVDVARMQIEGDSNSLKKWIGEAAVVKTLQDATKDYNEKADALKSGTYY